MATISSIQAFPYSSGSFEYLPTDVHFKIISYIPLPEFASIDLTCVRIHTGLWTHLNDLLSVYFPHFKKTDPNQSPLEALKEQYRIHSNVSNGVYTLQPLQNNAMAYSLALNDRKLFSGHKRGVIQQWNLETKAFEVPLSEHHHDIMSLMVKGEKTLFSGCLNGEIKRWNLETNSCESTFIGHGSMVLCLAGNEKWLFSGSADSSIKIWDLETNAFHATLQGVSHTFYNALVLNGETLISGSMDRLIKFWDFKSLSLIDTFSEHEAAVSSLALDVKRQILISGSGDGTIKIWDLNTRACMATLEGHEGMIFSLALDEEGQRLFSASEDCTIKCWDLKTYTCTATLDGHSHYCYNIIFDKNRLYSGSYDSTVKLWDFEASDEVVFEEIAVLMDDEDRSESPIGMFRFNRMPLKAKNAIFGELYHILKPFKNDYWGCGEDAFYQINGQKCTGDQRAQAIRNYLEKK